MIRLNKYLRIIPVSFFFQRIPKYLANHMKFIVYNIFFVSLKDLLFFFSNSMFTSIFFVYCGDTVERITINTFLLWKRNESENKIPEIKNV